MRSPLFRAARSAQSYAYDANGNLISGGGRTVTWTSFNQLLRADLTGGKFSEFAFGAGRERVRQTSHLGTTTYVGAFFERFTPTGSGAVTEDKHYLYAPTGRIAVVTQRSSMQQDTRWFHTDGLGSITVVTNEAGVVVKRFAFDAWGKRVTPSTNGVITTNATSGATASGGFTRGYTDHEQLDDLGLIHMNGRVYDPTLGRFLSADPNIDGVEDAQGYNRYSYVGNNPMNATDPSGFLKLKDALKIVAIVAATIITAGAALYAAAVWAGVNVGVAITTFGSALSALAGGGLSFAGAVIAGAGAGFGSGFAGSLLNGGSLGDAFKAGVIGAAIGGISAGIAHGIGTMAQDLGWGWEAQAAAHGVAQGGMSEAMGGEFRHGFYAGFFSSAFASSGLMNRVPGGVAGKTIASAVVGGTASAIGGGKFANGATSGAFTYLFNHAGSHLEEREQQLSDLKVGGVVFLASGLANEETTSGQTVGSYFLGLEKSQNEYLSSIGVRERILVVTFDSEAHLAVLINRLDRPIIAAALTAHGDLGKQILLGRRADNEFVPREKVAKMLGRLDTKTTPHIEACLNRRIGDATNAMRFVKDQLKTYGTR
jgi:RHS repeat-associated protein